MLACTSSSSNPQPTISTTQPEGSQTQQYQNNGIEILMIEAESDNKEGNKEDTERPQMKTNAKMTNGERETGHSQSQAQSKQQQPKKQSTTDNAQVHLIFFSKL